MSQPIETLPIATSAISDMAAHADAVGVKVYGTKAGADGYSQGGAANGLATLGADGKVLSAQVPSDLVHADDLTDVVRQDDLADYARNRNVVTALAINAGVVAVNCAFGDYFTLTASADVTGWTFTNVPPGCSLMIRVAQGGTPHPVAVPTSVLTGDTTAFASSAGAVDLLALTTFDGGNSWIGTLANVAAGS